MLRRSVIVLVVLVALAWVVGSGFVVVFEVQGNSAATTEAARPDDPLAEVARKWGWKPGGGFFRLGYVDTCGASWGSGDPVVWTSEYRCIFRRGDLDRASATFPFAARYAIDAVGVLETARLYVTSEYGHHIGRIEDDTAWTLVATASIHEFEGWSVAWFDEVDVPATSVHFRIEEIRSDTGSWSFSHSMPQHETWLGRLYDQVAWRGPFRWLPDLQ